MLASTCGAKWHLDGTAQIPPLIPTYPNGHVLTDEEEEWLDDLEKCWDNYNKCEAAVMVQIYTTVSDSILIKVHNLVTVKELWEAVCAKHETKALTVKVDIRCLCMN